MAEILLVEDDDESVFTTLKLLGTEHKITTARSLSQAREFLNSNIYHLILLDVMLPDGDGLEFLSELRNSSQFQLPILILTGKESSSDQALGYSLGAEDYILKPPQPIVFKARVESKLSKYKELFKQSDVFFLGDLKFDIPKYRLSNLAGTTEIPVDLTPIEFRLLLHMAKHEEQVFSRDQLISSVWGNNVHVFDRSIDAHICHIRSKLANTQCSIQSVHGVGYRLSLKKGGQKRSNNGQKSHRKTS